MSFHLVTDDGRVAIPHAYRTRESAENDRPGIEWVVGGPCHVVDDGNDIDRGSSLCALKYTRPPRFEVLA